MGFFPLCQFKFGISPSKSVESEPCKTDTTVGCDPACLCNICHLHQFKGWTWATHIINRLILVSEEDTAAKELYLKNIWELRVDLNVRPPRSSATCHHYSSLRAYVTHRKTELPTNTNLGFLWGAGGALPTPKSSALGPPAPEAQADPHCQAPTWGGVRADLAAEHLRLSWAATHWGYVSWRWLLWVSARRSYVCLGMIQATCFVKPGFGYHSEVSHLKFQHELCSCSSPSL